MFSGLKSILFGYSDPIEPTNSLTEQAQNAEDNVATIGTLSTSSISTDTSALLEQTLNAATTKFTEQLLPISPSIEQLQSSSHQLLPTLNEQHEELKKKKKNGEQAEGLKKEVQENDEDDDECFIADSWELLDLVESKPEQTVSIISAVQDKNLNNSTFENNTTKSSGILKQTKKRNNNQLSASSSEAERAEQQKKQNQRQKPKVSFETPDLVIEKQKIEPITPKDESSVKIKKSKSKNKRNKQVNKLITSTDVEVNEEKINDQKDQEEPSLEAKFEVISNIEKAPEVEEQSTKTPALNYAAVLSMKLKKNDFASQRPVDQNSNNSSKTLNTGIAHEVEEKKLQANGAIKRNRPVSTSSWSSCDEVEAVDLMWNKVDDQGVSKVVEEKASTSSALAPVVSFDNEDNESIASSGYSDCDYVYHGLNDFIMRPKKSQNKRRGGSATSSGLLNSMAKRGSERVPSSDPTTIKTSMDTSTCREQQEQKGGNTEAKGKRISSLTSSYVLKQTRSKKKKMTLSSSAPVTPKTPVEQIKKSTIAPSQPNRNDLVVSKSRGNLVSADAFLKPIAPVSTQNLNNNSSNNYNLVASSVSGNDSSDVAEMDESWYVTPPPCFTGSNKLDKPKPAKAKEAARENALIEHPSIYIAETSTQKLESRATCSSPFKLVENPTAKLQTNDGSKKSVDRSQKALVVLRNENKLKRKNKFVVTDWPSDEQDNMDDDFFDDIFDKLKLKKSPKKKNIRKKLSEQSKKVQLKSMLTSECEERIESPLFADLFNGYESDFSIPSPAPDGNGSTNTVSSIEMISNASTEVSLEALEDEKVESKEKDQDENKEPSVEEKATCVDVVESKQRRVKSNSEKRAPVVVDPILPERQPGWQLKKKRNKRRPLVIGSGNVKASPKNGSEQQASNNNSGSSSARSSPNLIDRIGQSIVANLTNLTSGFSGGAQQVMPLQPRAVMEEVEKLNQSVARTASAESNLCNRRRMSKSYLDRQNGCAKVASSARRADRRLKMHSTPNGVSVNRKVHTNVH